jgi:tRNA1Val (adenine37-N6)-methyltransferase
MIFTNPPYIKYDEKAAGGAGMLSGLDYKNISRREISCTIFDILKSAARLIKNGGDFYIVYRPDRFQSLFAAMAQYNITPKKIVFVYAGKNNQASLVLIKGRQGAGEGLSVENIFI